MSPKWNFTQKLKNIKPTIGEWNSVFIISVTLCLTMIEFQVVELWIQNDLLLDWLAIIARETMTLVKVSGRGHINLTTFLQCQFGQTPHWLAVSHWWLINSSIYPSSTTRLGSTYGLIFKHYSKVLYPDLPLPVNSIPWPDQSSMVRSKSGCMARKCTL